MLDSIGPLIVKDGTTVLPAGYKQAVDAPDGGRTESREVVGPYHRSSTRLPSYEAPGCLKGTDGVVYRAAGRRGMNSGSQVKR